MCKRKKRFSLDLVDCTSRYSAILPLFFPLLVGFADRDNVNVSTFATILRTKMALKWHIISYM